MTSVLNTREGCLSCSAVIRCILSFSASSENQNTKFISGLIKSCNGLHKCRQNLSKCVSFNLNKNGFSDIIYRFYTCLIISLKFIYVVIWERGRVGETVGNSKVVNIKISPYIFLFFFFLQLRCPTGISPMENLGCY